MNDSKQSIVLGADALAGSGVLAPYRKAFTYFLIITAFHGVLGRLVGYFLPVYFKELGFSGVQIGLYFSVSSIATLMLSLPMGITTDRKSISSIFMIATSLGAISYIGFIFTSSFAVFCAFAFVGSIGGRLYGTAGNTLFFKISRKQDSHDAGMYQLVSFASAGVGMFLGSLIIAGASFRSMFIAACIGNVILIGLSYFLPRTETVVIKVEEYRKEVFQPRVLFITLIFSLSSLHWGAEIVSYGPFLMNNLGLNIRQTGLFTSLGFIVVGLGAWLGAVLHRRKILPDMQAVLALGFLLAGVGQIMMCIPSDPMGAFAWRLLHEIGDGFVFLAFFNGIATVFHIDRIGGCAAFISLCQGLGSMSSAIVFGAMGDRYGHQWPLIISGAVMAVLPVLMMISRHKLDEGNLGSGRGEVSEPTRSDG